MNSKQRHKNRETAARLRKVNKQARLSKHVCENCGEFGGHWLDIPLSIEDYLTRDSSESHGRWLCTAKPE